MSEKLLFCASFPKLSFVEEEDLIADTLRFGEVMGHNDNTVFIFEIK